jgi:hypothetical protein
MQGRESQPLVGSHPCRFAAPLDGPPLEKGAQASGQAILRPDGSVLPHAGLALAWRPSLCSLSSPPPQSDSGSGAAIARPMLPPGRPSTGRRSASSPPWPRTDRERWIPATPVVPPGVSAEPHCPSVVARALGENPEAAAGTASQSASACYPVPDVPEGELWLNSRFSAKSGSTPVPNASGSS